jgi:hypothetical protein
MLPEQLKRFFAQIGTLGSATLLAAGVYIIYTTGAGSTTRWIGYAVAGTGVTGLGVSEGFLIA